MGCDRSETLVYNPSPPSGVLISQSSATFVIFSVASPGAGPPPRPFLLLIGHTPSAILASPLLGPQPFLLSQDSRGHAGLLSSRPANMRW